MLPYTNYYCFISKTCSFLASINVEFWKLHGIVFNNSFQRNSRFVKSLKMYSIGHYLLLLLIFIFLMKENFKT